MRRAGALVALLAVALPLGGPEARGAEAAGPIEHIVVIIEQNHTFDSYFAAYPGARGYATQGLEPALPDGMGGIARPQLYTEAVTPEPGSLSESFELLSNGPAAAREARNEGAMDGFVIAQLERQRSTDLVLTYHTRATAPLLWDLADQSVLFDNYFSSVPAGSLPNMLTLLTGDSQDMLVESKQTLARLATADFDTLFDVLERRGIPWNFYVGRLSDTRKEWVLSGRYLEPEVGTPPATYWAPLLAIRRFWSDPGLSDGLADQTQFYTDAAAGDLPAVSFLLPAPTDHPVTQPQISHTRLRSLLNALVKGPDWDATAVFVVWDDWGGSYDHVDPPDGLGFRVPALLVSPYAKAGHVSHVQHDHRSVLEFIAAHLGLPRFTRAPVAGFDDAFDFGAPPRPGPLYASDLLPPTPVGTTSINRATLALYLAALGAAAVTVAVAFGRRPTARPVGEPRS